MRTTRRMASLARSPFIRSEDLNNGGEGSFMAGEREKVGVERVQTARLSAVQRLQEEKVRVAKSRLAGYALWRIRGNE